MAELMKLLETNGAFKSDLMKNFLSSAMLNRDTSLSGGSLPVTAAPALSSSNLNLNISSPRAAQSSSFSSLPEPDAVNMNINVNTITRSNENLNENTAFVSRTLTVNVNLPRPRIVSLDNVNKNSSPNLNELNKTNLTSPDSNANANNNNGTANINVGATPVTMDTENGNINANTARQETVTQQIPIIPDPNANSPVDVDQILSEVCEEPSESRQLLIKQVTSAISDAHLNTTINTYANVKVANERIQKEASEMPDMSSLSINGSNLWQLFMGAMVPEMTKVIKFCTKLPGFPEVEGEDKINLIKQGCFEVMVARFCMLVDHVKEEMLDPTLQVKAPRHLVKEMPMGAFLDQFFTVASQFNPLGLTDEQIGLFTAILMICPERESLKNKAAVSVLQKLFFQALYQQLTQTHADAKQTLTSLINMMPVFHKINKDHLKFIKMIKMKSPAEYEKKFPTLHKELFDTC